MKKLIILLCFMAGLTGYGQNLTFDEVLKLRKSSLAEVEELLTSKNWSLLQATDPEESTMGKAVFAYNKNQYEDKAEAFLNFIYDAYTQRVGIQLSKPDVYNRYITRIKSLGLKMLDSKIENGEIIKVYQGPTTTIRVSVSTQKEDYSTTKTVYYFFICENVDYQLNFDSD